MERLTKSLSMSLDTSMGWTPQPRLSMERLERALILFMDSNGIPLNLCHLLQWDKDQMEEGVFLFPLLEWPEELEDMVSSL